MVLLTTTERKGKLLINLYGRLTDITVIKPRLGPPAEARSIRVDADKTRDIEALDVKVELSKRIDQLSGGAVTALLITFFFNHSSKVSTISTRSVCTRARRCSVRGEESRPAGLSMVGMAL